MDRRIYLLLGALCVLALLLFGGCEDGVLDSPESRVGKDWRVVELPPEISFIDIAASDDRFLALDWHHRVFRSFDGFDWECVLENIDYYGHTKFLCHAGDYFFIICSRAADRTTHILRSVDGWNWTASYSFPDNMLYPFVVLRAEQEYLTIDGYGSVTTSPDGRDWRHQPDLRLVSRATLITATCSRGRVMVLERSKLGAKEYFLATLEESTRWHYYPIHTEDEWRLLDIAWTRDSYAVAGYTTVGFRHPGFVLTSSAGETWEVRAMGRGSGLLSLAASDATIVAVGAGGTIMTSPDSYVWTLRAGGTKAQLYDVACTKDRAVAIGYSNTVLVSP